MEKQRLIKHFDWPIAATLLSLLVIGLVAVANSTTKQYSGTEEGIFALLARIDPGLVRYQAIWMVTGLALMAVVIAIDYRFIADVAPVVYWVTIAVLIILVLLVKTPGSFGRWFQIGENRTFQPSEIAKLAIIISLAARLSKRETPITTLRELVPILMYVGLPVLLVALQPDVGTALVFIVITLGMLFVSGISLKLFFGMVMTGIISLVPVWFIIGEFRRNRVLTFLNPELDPLGTGYQVTQSKIAVGSGQLMGQGLFREGGFSQLDYVPVKSSDFIFSVTAESVGFVGCVAIIALFAILMYRMVALSAKMTDRFSSLVIIGVVFMMLFHVFENIGMTIGLMPVTGIPLPFISYGGSSMWANLIAMGLVLNVAMRRGKRTVFGST